MRLGLIFRLFRNSAKIQRKRIVLTVIAIAWGTVSIVMLLAFGEGLKRSLHRSSRGTGEGLLIIWPGETSIAYAGFPAGRDIDLLPEDVDLLVRSIPEIGSASGEMTRWGTLIRYSDKDLIKKITGVHPSFGDMRHQYANAGGRFLNRLDYEKKRRVIFLGDELKQDLFGDAPAIGETVLVQNVPFTVVGDMIHKMQTGMYGGPDAGQGVVPISTFEALYGRRFLSNMVLKPARPELMEVMKRRTFEVLGSKYRFDPEDERALQTWDTQASQEIQGKMMLGIEIFLGIIGALTLIIGGVGVANIMYAVVQQRTAEIGVQMALGARRSWVLGPLVLEALSMTFAGGFFGLLIGAGLVEVLGYFQSQATGSAMAFMGRPTFSLPLVLITIAILGAIGFFSGYFPARRATAIQPAAVLRYE